MKHFSKRNYIYSVEGKREGNRIKFAVGHFSVRNYYLLALKKKSKLFKVLDCSTRQSSSNKQTEEFVALNETKKYH
jgi:hypothetical protein